MKRVFGVKKQKDPPPTIQDATDRGLEEDGGEFGGFVVVGLSMHKLTNCDSKFRNWLDIAVNSLILISKRGDNVDDKIKKLDAELSRYREQIKKTRPGPAQEAVKARAMRILKQKHLPVSYKSLKLILIPTNNEAFGRYEGQRDMLYNQTFNLDQVAFASEGIKDAQQTAMLDTAIMVFNFVTIRLLLHAIMTALKSANKELKGMMKTVKIQDIDAMQDEMMDLMDVSNEIQESLGRSYNVPDDIDEEELMGELEGLEADMGMETESDSVPSYLQPDKEPDTDAELNLPSAPTGHAGAPPNRNNAQVEDELGLPAVPRASIRG
ncbi:hypothetical protein Syun_002449 [Stephania yunnanensis]|uniref:Uncharacterized protein n=1 Tax=Stephania yunnanensis TaxID=152371 RepID=A0AAP0LJQ8_9MAGN